MNNMGTMIVVPRAPCSPTTRNCISTRMKNSKGVWARQLSPQVISDDKIRVIRQRWEAWEPTKEKTLDTLPSCRTVSVQTVSKCKRNGEQLNSHVISIRHPDRECSYAAQSRHHRLNIVSSQPGSCSHRDWQTLSAQSSYWATRERGLSADDPGYRKCVAHTQLPRNSERRTVSAPVMTKLIYRTAYIPIPALLDPRAERSIVDAPSTPITNIVGVDRETHTGKSTPINMSVVTFNVLENALGLQLGTVNSKSGVGQAASQPA